MKGFIDRIEDTKAAVVILEEGGQMLIPADAIPFKIREGMHLHIKFTPDPESEEKRSRRIKNLQQELLKRTEETDKDQGKR